MASNTSVGYVRLYREASTWHRVVLCFSALMAVAAGAATPLLTVSSPAAVQFGGETQPMVLMLTWKCMCLCIQVVIGHEIGDVKKFASGEESSADFKTRARRYPIYFVYFGLAQFIAIYLSTIGFMVVGDHVSRKISGKYLRALLYKQISFFDTLGTGEATARLTDGVHLVHAAVAEKAAAMIMAGSTIITAVVVSLATFWKLGLISMSSFIALLLVIGSASRFIGMYSDRCLEAHAQSSQVAEEALSSIQVVKALGAAAPKLVDKFDCHLVRAVSSGRKSKVALGSLIGGVLAVAMLNVGLGLWQGSRYVLASETSPGAVSTIILSMLIGTFTLVTLAPIIGTIASGLAAASKIFSLIEEETSSIEPTSEGRVLQRDELHGNIEFRNITFQYPSRPETTVLHNVSLTIPAGKVTALVGASGSGKSTFVNLLQRFYPPAEGAVLIDDHDISQLDTRWLRQQMALVDQEPVLFSDTILHNIAIGLTGSERASAGLTDAETTDAVMDAATQAGLHEFISSLPWGYQTVLHEGGASLSGGQRQRIAISRALIRDPKILLLDEASSALDAKSERHIQSVIDSGDRQRRTTVVIAHRLSTVRDADNIIVMKEGQVVEQGSHDELYELRGQYYALLHAQQPHNLGDGSAESENAPSSSLEDDTHDVDEPDYSAPKTKDPLVTSESFRNNVDSTDIELTSVSHHHPRFGRLSSPQKNSIISLLRFVMHMNRKNLGWTILGLLASSIAGCGTPIHVVFLSHGITSLSIPTFAEDQMRSDISLWSGMYIMLAVVLLSANLIHSWALGLSSERLMFKAKTQTFRVLLDKELSFFDTDSASTGALVSFLSTEPAALGGISGPILGMLVSVSTTITVSVAIAIGFGWKLGLVATATVPVLLVSGFLRLHLLARMEQKTKTVFEKAMSRAREAIAAIRMVASLTLEEDVLSKYQAELNVQRMTHVLSVSMLYSMSFAFFFFCMALIMWYGTDLLAERAYTVLMLWICFVEIMFSTQSAGALFAFAPDLARAKEAAKRLKDLIGEDENWSRKRDKYEGFDSRDSAEKTAVERQSGDLGALRGRLEFQDVEFAYPSRPRHRVLNGLSFTVEPGQFVAFVGPSGSGKSTIISLLERFYAPHAGVIRVDGESIGSLNVDKYRSQMALVNQDICLFQGTVRENILLGLVNGQSPPSEEELFECCKAANIHDLVISLP